MTWTYDLTQLTTPGSISEVRLKIGDTIPADPLLQDEEIAYFQTIEQSLELVCALCCEAVAALYARLADSSDGSISQSMSQKSAQYRERAQELRRQAPMVFGWGGISQAAKDALNQDTDAVQPLFRKGGDDIPGTPSSTRTLNGVDPFFEGF